MCKMVFYLEIVNYALFLCQSVRLLMPEVATFISNQTEMNW